MATLWLVPRRLPFVLLAISVWLVPAKANAVPCSLPTDCPSGFCEDGVCCDVACPGECMACSAAAKGQGADGSCGPVKAGTECHPGGCSNDLTFDPPDLCDGTGQCVESGAGPSCITNDPCAFDLCGDTGCEIVYKIDGTECGAGKVCIDNACVPDATGGASGAGGGSAGSGGSGASANGGDAGSNGGGADGGPVPSASSSDDDSGCGCRAAGARVPASTALGLAVVLLLLRSARRRR